MALKYRRLLSFLTVSLILRATVASVVGTGAILATSDIILPRPEVASTSIPVRQAIDPSVIQQPEIRDVSAEAALVEQPLDVNDGTQGGQFGFSVAVDGSTAVVGAPGDAGNRGAAYVYKRAGENWILQQKLLSQDGASDDHFGWDVAISGETILVGSYDLNEADSGAAYVFTRSGEVWGQEQKITPSAGSVTDQFGSSVAISGDTAVVGAYGNNGFRGAAYVFVRNGGVWTEQQKLSGSDTIADDEFGWSVALSGESVVVGAPRKQSVTGAAYIYLRSGQTWSEQQKLTASDGASFAEFGSSVAIDGGTALVGAVMDGGEISRGSAYVFERSGESWTQAKKLIAADGAKNDKFGESVSLNGNIAVIGANGRDANGVPDRGSVYIFSRAGSDWTLTDELSPSDPAVGDNFGASVAADIGVAVVGSHLKDIGGPAMPTIDHGAAYSFALPMESVTVSGRVLSVQGNAVRGAKVILTDVGSGATSTFITAQLGFFTFPNVAVGRTYQVTVSSKRYRYNPQTFELTGAMSDLQFNGVE